MIVFKEKKWKQQRIDTDLAKNFLKSLKVGEKITFKFKYRCKIKIYKGVISSVYQNKFIIENITINGRKLHQQKFSIYDYDYIDKTFEIMKNEVDYENIQ